MVTAYLLINTKPGSETKIAEFLIKKKQVKDLNIVYGAYDIIMKLKVRDMGDLQNFILQMRKDVEVEHTTTLISTSAQWYLIY